MASARLVPIVGPRPPQPVNPDEAALEKTIKEKIASLKKLSRQQPGSKELYTVFPELEWLESFIKGSSKDLRQSRNPVHFLAATSIGNQRLQSTSFDLEYATRHLIRNDLWRERAFNLGRCNKIFCSQWLNHRQVVLGTKCNSLVVLDVNTGKSFKIPSLPSSGNYQPVEQMMNCGIHAIEINPSRTLLATGAEKPYELAIYKLPSFEPVAVGENCHEDWIFDISWLDDEYLVTGSRDSRIALWRVDRDQETTSNESREPYYMQPLTVVTGHKCKEPSSRIRSLLFNDKNNHLVALSQDSKLHLFDINTFSRTKSMNLPSQSENVCISHYSNGSQYAIGGKNQISLVDARDFSPSTNKIFFKQHTCGVRSLNFVSDLLSIGTGHSVVMFYDMRARKFIQREDEREVALSSSRGSVQEDDSFHDSFQGNVYGPAIYTHKFDSSKMRLFAAGGPLPTTMSGCYAGLWI